MDLINYPSSRYIPKIRTPTLFVYGDHDPFCDPADEMAAFRDLGAESKAIVIVGNASHGLVLEKLAHKQVYSLVYQWVALGGAVGA